ncbi:hypothetical protein TNCV_2384971 [Trichonephila clavipes]|nr:hypothetical protein TNCV_2384971 [Trichonephila clavipes]
MQVTVRFCLVPPQFRERKPCGWSGDSHISSPSTHHTSGSTAILSTPMPPRHYTSMSSPGFEPSPYGTASLTTIEENLMGFGETTGEHLTNAMLGEVEKNGLDNQNCRGRRWCKYDRHK